jgi:hypothetical protein
LYHRCFLEQWDILPCQLVLKLGLQERTIYTTPLIPSAVSAYQHQDLPDGTNTRELPLPLALATEDILLFSRQAVVCVVQLLWKYEGSDERVDAVNIGWNDGHVLEARQEVRRRWM